MGEQDGPRPGQVWQVPGNVCSVGSSPPNGGAHQGIWAVLGATNATPSTAHLGDHEVLGFNLSS